MVYLLTIRFYLVSMLWTLMLELTGVAITLAFTCHCFSFWICVDGAWTSLPIPLVMKAYMTKSHSWLEHILSSSSSWCSMLGCSWSFHQWCGHHFPVALLIIAHPLILRLGWVLPGAAWPNPLWMTSQSSLWLLLAQLWLWFLVHSSRLTILAYTTWLRFLAYSAQSSTPARLAQSESPTRAAWLRSPGCLGLF